VFPLSQSNFAETRQKLFGFEKVKSTISNVNQPYFWRRCGSGMEKKDEEELDSWSLKHGTVGDVVAYLEGE